MSTNFQTTHRDYVTIALNVLLGRVVAGQFENDFGGFQQYTKAIASTVARVC